MPSLFFSQFFGPKAEMVGHEGGPLDGKTSSFEEGRSGVMDLVHRFGQSPAGNGVGEQGATGGREGESGGEGEGDGNGIGGESPQSPGVSVGEVSDKSKGKRVEEGREFDDAGSGGQVNKQVHVQFSGSNSNYFPTRKSELEKGKKVVEIEEDERESPESKALKSVVASKSDLSVTSGSMLSQFLEKLSPRTSRSHSMRFAPLAVERQNEKFTNPEKIPPADICMKEFQEIYPKYLETTDIDKLRKEHYAHLQDSGHVCLDYCGYGLFSHFQQVQNKSLSSFGLAYISANLATHALYGAADGQSAEGCIRKRIMQYLNISETEYSMVFTASRGSAFKLLAESYPFHVSGRLLTVYDHDSESVKWMVESARQRGAKVMSALFKWPSLRVCAVTLKKQIKGRWRNVPHKRRGPERWNKLFLSLFRRLTGVRKAKEAQPQENRRKKDVSKGLFVFPMQSRITGSKLAYQWMSYAQQNKWHVLLDASALGPKDMCSLGLSLFRPDFIVASFFKVFGADPTGFGCLFIKNSAMPYLQSSYRARGVGMVRIVPYGSYASPDVSPSKVQQQKPARSGELKGGKEVYGANGQGTNYLAPGTVHTGVSSFSGPVQAEYMKRPSDGPSGLLSENVYVGYAKAAYIDEKSGTSETTFASGSLYASGSLPPSSSLYASGSFYPSSSAFPSGSIYPSGALHTPPSGSLYSSTSNSDKFRRNSSLDQWLDVGFSGPMSPHLKKEKLGPSLLREHRFASSADDKEDRSSHQVRGDNSIPSSSPYDELQNSVGEVSRGRGQSALGMAIKSSSRDEGEISKNSSGSSVHEPEMLEWTSRHHLVAKGSSSVRPSQKEVERFEGAGHDIGTGNLHERYSKTQTNEGMQRENSFASSTHDIEGSSGRESFTTPPGELLDLHKDFGRAGIEVDGGHTVYENASEQSHGSSVRVFKDHERDTNRLGFTTEGAASSYDSQVQSTVGAEEGRFASGVVRSAHVGTMGSAQPGFAARLNNLSSRTENNSILGSGDTGDMNHDDDKRLTIPVVRRDAMPSFKENAVSRESEKAYEMLGCRDREAQRRLLVINREIADMDGDGTDTFDLSSRESSLRLGSRGDSLYNIQEVSSGATQSEESDYTEGVEDEAEVADTAGIPQPAVFCQSLDHADFMGLNRTNMRQRYLSSWLIHSLMKLEHPGGRHLVHVYGPNARADRGQSVAFNVFDWNGNLLQPGLVQRLADRSNIALGLGSLCNIEFPEDVNLVPGLVMKKTGIKQGETSRPRIRVVTASLGFVSNFEDVYRLWHFVAKFLDVDFLFREVWRYHSLNQETVVLGDGSVVQDSSQTG